MGNLCLVWIKNENQKTRISLSVYEVDKGSLKETKSHETSSHLYLEVLGKIVMPLGLVPLNLHMVIRECDGEIVVSEEKVSIL
jgi:hypothetical protein